jgi:cellulose synthase/poly-beta-1,6-N-acetylglucosamine synthase-like glycosyltransferase
MEYIFFFALFMICYIYLGYPAIIYIISLMRNKKVEKGHFEPTVTILIAAFNEEDCIEKTITNKLNLLYPKKQLEIIIVSDESTDKTDEIVKKYERQGVKLLRQAPRAGKTSALNMAFPEAAGEILIFSDANSLYAPDAVNMLVRNFVDPEVGYVSGKMIYTNPDGSTIGEGCSAYMAYENFLRKFETKVGSIVGVDGGIDAVRKKLYQPMKPDQLPDFVLPLKVVEQGYRVVYEPGAILKESSLNNTHDEYRMRVRVSLRALWALYDMHTLLSIKKNTFFAWQLWSHKVLRYLCFLFLLTAYFSNLSLWHCGLCYRFCFLLQNALYAMALLFPFMEKRSKKLKLLALIHYFAVINLAAAHAFIKFILGQKQMMWTPRKG